MTKMMRSRFLNSKFWLDLFFPNRCPCCDKVIIWDKLICEKCSDSIPYLSDEQWQIRYPTSIMGDEIYFDYAVSAFAYQSPAKEGIFSLKRGNGTNFAEFSAGIICEKIESDEKNEIDLITAVPMSRSKKSARGYNQAEILAEYIGKNINVNLNFDLLCRQNISLEQHSLDAKGRHSLANQIYYSSEKDFNISGLTVLLCDDVFTTGATLNKCAKLLKNMGAEKVYCASICYTEFNINSKE